MQADTTTADSVTTAVPNPFSDSQVIFQTAAIFHQQAKTPLVSGAWQVFEYFIKCCANNKREYYLSAELLKALQLCFAQNWNSEGKLLFVFSSESLFTCYSDSHSLCLILPQDIVSRPEPRHC
jgi:hypothetical protein